jgi:hypothetical protein
VLLLPILSEANPNEFLLAVENAINASSSPFDELFDQEDAGVFGRNSFGFASDRIGSMLFRLPQRIQLLSLNNSRTDNTATVFALPWVQ